MPSFQNGADRPAKKRLADTWLQAYLAESAQGKLCTLIHCTTCGATKFRRGMLLRLTDVTGQPAALPIDRHTAHMLATALRDVQPSPDELEYFDGAVRLILFEAWHALSLGAPLTELDSILQGTWAGDVLHRMQAHHEERMEARRQRADRNDPVKVAARREEKRRQRQGKRAERFALKKERDRIWRLAHPETPGPRNPA